MVGTMAMRAGFNAAMARRRSVTVETSWGT
jgi:hypothetical protein